MASQVGSFPSTSFAAASKGQPWTVEQGSAQRQAQEFINKAKAVADDILGEESASASVPCDHIGRVKVYHYYDYGWGWGGWGYGSPVYVIDGGSRRSRRDDDNDAGRVLIGLVAAVIGGIALYKLGGNINRYRQAEEELSDIRPFHKWAMLNANTASEADRPFFQKVEKIAELDSRIFKRIKSAAAWDLATTVGIVAGSALALLGSVLAVKACITAGILVGCAAGAVMLFNWGLDSTDRDQRRDAQALRAAVSNAASV